MQVGGSLRNLPKVVMFIGAGMFVGLGSSCSKSDSNGSGVGGLLASLPKIGSPSTPMDPSLGGSNSESAYLKLYADSQKQ